MTRLNPNHVALIAMVLALALLAVFFGYRIEIGPAGLTFERDTAQLIRQDFGV